MATLASLLFALALNPDSLEPRIDWVYTATACESCTREQADVMARFFRKGDRIFIQAASKKRTWAKELMARFKKDFPGTVILKEQAPYDGLVTGWILTDPITGEDVVYQTRKDTYGTFRSQTMLEIFRDPNDP